MLGCVDLTRLADIISDEGTPLVRTDFSDDGAWQAVVTAVTAPVRFDADPDADFDGVPGDDGYAPYVVVVDDRTFVGVTGAVLGELVTATPDVSGYVLLADARTTAEALAGGEITLDYVDLSVTDAEEAEDVGSFLGRTFRCSATEVASVEANLSISNLDFSDFADHTDPDGVHRGFGDV